MDTDWHESERETQRQCLYQQDVKREDNNTNDSQLQQHAKAVVFTYPELVRCRRNWLEKQRMHAKQDAIKSMRAKVRDLEKHYEALTERVDAAQALACHEPRLHQLKQDQEHDRLTLGQVALHTSEVKHSSLQELVQEMHSLIHENTDLRELVEEHIHFQNKLRLIQDTANLGSSISFTPHQFDHLNMFCYVPFHVDECFTLIRKDLVDYVSRKPDFTDPAANRHLPFGWRGRVYFENANLCRVQMTKEWPGHPTWVCDTMWMIGTKEMDPRRVYSEQHCFEILQHVTDDIKIGRRRVFSHGWTCWSVFMLYRTGVDDSYLIGIVPLPLWGNGTPVNGFDAYGKSFLGSKETLAIRPLHHLLEPVAKSNGVVHTRVYRWGFSLCDQHVFMPLFEECAVDTILRFERLVLFPVVTNMIKTSDDSMNS